jgi:hypothetical protein
MFALSTLDCTAANICAISFSVQALSSSDSFICHQHYLSSNSNGVVRCLLSGNKFLNINLKCFVCLYSHTSTVSLLYLFQYFTALTNKSGIRDKIQRRLYFVIGCNYIVPELLS